MKNNYLEDFLQDRKNFLKEKLSYLPLVLLFNLKNSLLSFEKTNDSNDSPLIVVITIV